MAAAGATCTSSSRFSAGWDCQYALDGVLTHAGYAAWASAQGSGAGTWIRVTFNEIYRIVRARFMSRFHVWYIFKDIELEFDNQETMQVMTSLFMETVIEALHDCRGPLHSM